MRFDDPLLALVGATAEWAAGTPPSCSARVRLLDRVHFTVHRGDCVIVHHEDPAAARVLLAALAGHPALPVGRVLFGERRCAPRVRIRRSSIRTEVIAPMLDGWHEADDAGSITRVITRIPARDQPHPVVHLLRASREGPVQPVDARQWRAWAARERASGGAVVIVARPEHAFARSFGAPRALAVHDQPPRPSHADLPLATHARERGDPYDAPRPRTLRLHHGQLVNVRTWQ